MDGEYDDFEEVFRLLATDLSHIIRRDAYKPDVERICCLTTANEKLVYLFTLFFQPQHYSSYRRILGIRSETTLDKTLRVLATRKYMQKDANQFWWIQREETKNDDIKR